MARPKAGSAPALASEARGTPLPNGGRPMGATALRLGVRLREPCVCALNGPARSPGAADVALALRLATRAAWLAVGFALLGNWLRLR